MILTSPTILHHPFGPHMPAIRIPGEVAYLDAQVGEFLKGLEMLGLGNKTLVVIVSDHGEGLGDHGEYTHGLFLYDAVVRVPLLMVGPGVPAGK